MSSSLLFHNIRIYCLLPRERENAEERFLQLVGASVQELPLCGGGSEGHLSPSIRRNGKGREVAAPHINPGENPNADFRLGSASGRLGNRALDSPTAKPHMRSTTAFKLPGKQSPLRGPPNRKSETSLRQAPEQEPNGPEKKRK